MWKRGKVLGAALRGAALCVLALAAACSLIIPPKQIQSVDPAQVSGRWYFLGQQVAWMDLFLRPDKTGAAGTIDGRLSSGGNETATLSGRFLGAKIGVDLAHLGGAVDAGAKLDLRFSDGNLVGTVSDACGRWPAQDIWFEPEGPLTNPATTTAVIGGALDLSGPWVDPDNHLLLTLAADAATADLVANHCDGKIAQGAVTVIGKTLEVTMSGIGPVGDPATRTSLRVAVWRDSASPLGIRLKGDLIERKADGSERQRPFSAYRLGMFERWGYLPCVEATRVPTGSPTRAPVSGVDAGVGFAPTPTPRSPLEARVSEAQAVTSATRGLRSFDHAFYRVDQAVLVNQENWQDKVSARNRGFGWFGSWEAGRIPEDPFWLVYFHGTMENRDPCGMSATIDAHSGKVVGSWEVPWP